MSGKLLHKRSTVITEGEPKLPSASQIDYGEIAINYAAGVETISIKNSNNQIIKFSSDNAIENKISAEKQDLSGNVISYIDSNVVGVYRYKGSVTNYSDLSSISSKENGDVYNVENANGNIPPGTNYAWNETGNTWDSLGGSVDLSNYTTSDSFTAHTASTTVHVSTSEKNTWSGKQDSINDLTTIRNNASSGATAYTTLTGHTADTTIHVTSNEKSTWNGKQNSISDLTTIRNNASSGATAYNNMITGITAGGDNVTVSNKVASIPSASTSDFGVMKVGNFLTSTDGVVSVATGATNSTVARGNHTHTAYASTGNLNTLSSATVDHVTASTLHLPLVTSSDNGKILQVVNGAWALVTPVSIFSGTTAPDNLLGNNGDIYIQL